MGHNKRREAAGIRQAVKVQPITLKKLREAGIVHLRVACLRCPRRGRYSIPGLIAKHGAAMDLVRLQALLSGNCERRSGQLLLDPCGCFYPDRFLLEVAGGANEAR